VNGAAGVILAALEQNRTAAGIALALESAGLLMTPETAADMASVSTDAVRVAEESLAELKREHEANAALRTRVAELDAQREALSARLRAGQRWKQGRTPALVSQDFVSQDELRAMFGIPMVAPWDEPTKPDALTRTFAPTAALREDPHDSPLHHGYRLGRDLPQSDAAP
jgi:hypothetical protein